jgi:hypothetical protein
LNGTRAAYASPPDENAQKQDVLSFLLDREFARPPPGTLFLLSCRFTKMMRLNMDLLHICLSKFLMDTCDREIDIKDEWL